MLVDYNPVDTPKSHSKQRVSIERPREFAVYVCKEQKILLDGELSDHEDSGLELSML